MRHESLKSAARATTGCLALGLLLAPVIARSQGHPSRGLWAGEVVLNKVNEVVTGINSANQSVVTDPAIATPTADQASLRLLLHVDDAGQVRLLKSLVVFDRATNGGASDIALVTDEARYGNYPPRAKRLAAAAFDFGEGLAAEALNHLATAVAQAAGTNSGAEAASAELAASNAITSANIDAFFHDFATESALASGAFHAARSAAIAAVTARGTNGNAQQILSAAQFGATNDPFLVSARSEAATLQAQALFPDPRYVQTVDAIAVAVATAAATAAATNATIPIAGLYATNAARVLLEAAASAPTATSAGYVTFISSPAFTTNGSVAASAAAAAAVAERARSGSVQSNIVNAARSAALQALNLSRAFAAADAVPLHEAKLTGELTPSGVVSGRIYLGANHPTNPFRHRRHPSHTTGMSLTRTLTLSVATNRIQQVGWGVDRLSGVYREEISGLHKPLGQNQDIGLKTEGVFNLNRVSLVSTLNP